MSGAPGRPPDNESVGERVAHLDVGQRRAVLGLQVGGGALRGGHLAAHVAQLLLGRVVLPGQRADLELVAVQRYSIASVHHHSGTEVHPGERNNASVQGPTREEALGRRNDGGWKWK